MHSRHTSLSTRHTSVRHNLDKTTYTARHTYVRFQQTLHQCQHAMQVSCAVGLVVHALGMWGK
jgi:hypothetical protein